MPYQYVREPLTADESDRLSNTCETPTDRLVIWTLLDTGLADPIWCDETFAERRGAKSIKIVSRR
jgi:integrase/recombinase XerD